MSDGGSPEGGSSTLLVLVAAIGTPVFLVVMLILVLGGGGQPPPCAPGAAAAGPASSPGVGPLSPNGIPVDMVALIQAAGSVCPEFPAPVIAAQLKQESGFNPRAVSETGAEGVAQFEPGTWPGYGGTGDPFNPADAIPAQAKYDCEMAGAISAANASGQLHLTVSVTEATLFGYNAGLGAVLASGNGVANNTQSAPYVAIIMNWARTEFSTAGTDAAGSPAPAASTSGGAAGTGDSAAGCGGGVQVTITQVSYPVPGGGTQPADLYTPAGAGAGTTPRPIVVGVHGGGYYTGNRAELAGASKALSEHGYLVLNIDYDLSAPRWPRQLDQVGAAIGYARTVPGADGARVAVLGDSAGAGLALEAGLLGDHDGVQAVVSWSGPSDFLSLPSQTGAPVDPTLNAAQSVFAITDPAIYLGCVPALCPDLYRQASPALSMTPGAPPTFLVNSDKELVPLGQLTEMQNVLNAQGVPNQTLVFPGARHATDYTADANGPSISFLDGALHFTPPPPPTASLAVGGSGGGGPQAQQVVAAAQTQLGVPYVWGGTTPGVGLDCSGLTQWAFKQAGIDLPRTTDPQYAATAATQIPGGFNPAAYQPGDLLFWGTAGNIHHVAIAIGNGQLIEAPDVGQTVSTRPIYQSDFFAATRPIGAAPGGTQ